MLSPFEAANKWVWVKIKPAGDRGFRSMLPLTRVPLYPFLTHSHIGGLSRKDTRPRVPFVFQTWRCPNGVLPGPVAKVPGWRDQLWDHPNGGTAALTRVFFCFWMIVLFLWAFFELIFCVGFPLKCSFFVC